ncbi:type II toxin-antitoxin system VapC family toxin [Thiorhodovibrio frisius]|uniref:Ribonuclease VapC n=1 Tax=Thiorhodovibrio frisius TaxID=631362 RepID=H8YZ16_9GAMM|nr:type II toxin-antitoxin system VapC family toxin [Thiorhodovibrio frisius]EIC21943.1 putative nucleic acid-binding protein [Thiorhodovibrio frisius]WPL24232.1 putative ribonuclease VapC3 [Thiorhodovibrio frisius]
MIVVDASAVIDVLLQTPDSLALTNRLLDAGALNCAPQLIDIEIVSVMRRLVHRREIPEARASAALADFEQLPLERYPHQLLLPRIWAYRRLTAYDAAYLALADALDCRVITRDKHFAASAPERIELI